ALQQRTAIAEFREYIAHRQLVEWMSRFSAELPQMPVRPKPGRREVPARILEEDAYPVGGYTSISNRGSIESLLHSQLAFMEPHDRPDLFDVKFVRDELFYYSRDENQFLRRRRKFIIRFDQSISQYRTKDPSLPVQRSVLMLAATAVLIDRLRMWLATDSLQVEYQFVGFTQELTGIEEARLLAILSQEAMARGETEIVAVADDVTAHSRAEAAAGLSQVHLLSWGANPTGTPSSRLVQYGVVVDSPRPSLMLGQEVFSGFSEESDDLQVWLDLVRILLELWI
ncbi:MAG: hypothetical protein ACRCZF_15355, partial [Gemmataceae bacterium]